jgi:cytochrome P450
MLFDTVAYQTQPALVVFFGAAIAFTTIGLISNVIYNLFLNPLVSFPGPRICAISRIPQLLVTISGKQLDVLQYLHNVYGGVVRIAPDTLTYTDGRAWADICGATKYAKDGMAKEPRLAALIGGENTNPEPGKPRRQQAHGLMRMAMLPAFKASNVRSMEGVIQANLAEYFQAIDAGMEHDGKIDMRNMNIYLICNTFFELLFSESLNLFKSAKYQSWVHSFDRFSRAVTILAVVNRFPFVQHALRFVVQRLGAKDRDTFMEPILDHFDRRVASGQSRNDFLEYLLEGEGKVNTMSLPSLREFVPFLVLGGCDTMPTVMAGLYYFLAQNNNIQKRVVEEVRSYFESEQEITLARLANVPRDLPYFEACLQEAFRCYSPAGTGTDREVPQPGARIADRWVPGGTVVIMLHQPTFTSQQNFTQANEFRPERWLDNESGRPKEFESDQRGVLKPFSTGPQACPGQE